VFVTKAVIQHELKAESWCVISSVKRREAFPPFGQKKGFARNGKCRFEVVFREFLGLALAGSTLAACRRRHSEFHSKVTSYELVSIQWQDLGVVSPLTPKIGTNSWHVIRNVFKGISSECLVRIQIGHIGGTGDQLQSLLEVFAGVPFQVGMGQ
jgi:hypothetical protein